MPSCTIVWFHQNKTKRTIKKQMQTDPSPLTALPLCKCNDTATPACGFSQDKLITLLEKANFDTTSLPYTRFFKSLTCTNGDTMDHCKECSKTIAKHAVVTSQLGSLAHLGHARLPVSDCVFPRGVALAAVLGAFRPCTLLAVSQIEIPRLQQDLVDARQGELALPVRIGLSTAHPKHQLSDDRVHAQTFEVGAWQ